MTVLGTIGGMLPLSARNIVLRARERWRLARVEPEECDAKGLGRLDRAWLDAVLRAPELESEWRAVEEESAALRITESAGGVNPGDRRALFYLIWSLKPARILEVGTHIGASTVHIAAALRASARDGGPVPDLTTVDIEDVNDPVRQPWIRSGSTYAPAEMIARMGMATRVRFVAQPSLAYLAAPGEEFDFIFLDGDHRAPTVYRELPAALRRLRSGGSVLLHDYYPSGRSLWRGDPVIPGPWVGVDRLLREGAGFDVLPLGALPWPTKLGTHLTSLALVTRADAEARGPR